MPDRDKGPRTAGPCPQTNLPHKWSDVPMKAMELADRKEAEFADHFLCVNCGIIQIRHFDQGIPKEG